MTTISLAAVTAVVADGPGETAKSTDSITVFSTPSNLRHILVVRPPFPS